MVAFTPPQSAVSQGPSAHAFAIVPSDTANFGNLTRYIYVGGAGNLTVVHAGDSDANAITYTAVPVGTVMPICARKVMATATTATLLIGMY